MELLLQALDELEDLIVAFRRFLLRHAWRARLRRPIAAQSLVKRAAAAARGSGMSGPLLPASGSPD
jgi:hypothetical protein